MPTGYQVLKFVMVDFDRLWKRNLLADAVVEYKPLRPGARLSVVFEGQTGIMTTYHYKISDVEAGPVWIVDQVIHIPDRCVKQEKGNTIKCG